MSTPYGQRGFFWEVWTQGGEEWERTTAAATECARIPEAFLREEREALGSLWFAQEYLCEFVDNGGQWFARDAVERALWDETRLEI